ncbi:MAG TPA: carboxylesterase family protein [Terracidiphilus sp.]|nr:carboxylesterase family protein [Terracidiphilus sp.]
MYDGLSQIETNCSSGEHVRSILRVLGRIALAVVLVVIVFILYLKVRGGFYSSYAAATFSNLAAPDRGAHAQGDLMAQTDSGALKGTQVGPAIAFMGIPFARPPVGDLRWEPPQPALPWTGVRDASRPGPACTQDPAGLTPFLAPMARAYGSDYAEPPVDFSEDCLFLNVWVPEWPAKRALPVMVWIHGGSNRGGSGSQSTYNGVSLTTRGVLLVTLNYRLGVLGFFSHPELTAQSPHHSSGNYGLLDQIAALEWVQKNIARFGGDPGNVTLFGESAGAIDSAMLMTSPLAAGLFRRVISESGPAFNSAQTLSQAEAQGKAIGDLAPGDPHASSLQRLRALRGPAVEKLVAQVKAHYGDTTSSFTMDGWVLPRSPRNAFLTGSILKVDLLIGLNGREFSAFRLAAAAAAKSSGNQKQAASSGSVKQFADPARPYFGMWTNPVTAFYLGDILMRHDAGLDHALNDLIGACPIGSMAEMTSDAGRHVFAYRFDRSVPGKGEAELGAFHSIEIPYVFGALHDPTWKWLPFTPDDAALSNLVQTYWINFAKSGNPNAQGLPNWPAWSDAKKEFLEVKKDGAITAHRNFPPPFSFLSAVDLRKHFKSE